MFDIAVKVFNFVSNAYDWYQDHSEEVNTAYKLVRSVWSYFNETRTPLLTAGEDEDIEQTPDVELIDYNCDCEAKQAAPKAASQDDIKKSEENNKAQHSQILSNLHDSLIRELKESKLYTRHMAKSPQPF